MLNLSRQFFTKLLAVRPTAGVCYYSNPAPGKSETEPAAIVEVAEDEPVIPEEVETGIPETEDVVMIRKKYNYSQNVLTELKLDQYPYYVEREWWKKGNRMTFWATWRMLRDVKRRESLAEHGAERMRLKALKNNNILPQAIRDEASDKLHDGMPRYSRPNLILNMCQFTGRRRGKIKPYRVNRHIFRKLSDHGQLSGVQRAMW